MFERFQQYLIANGSIPSKQIPYYVKWVLECYTLLKCQPETAISSEQQRQYLEHLVQSREEWQVKQADQALKLYKFFLSKFVKNPAPSNDTERSWEQAFEEMVNLLRLRHMSLNTEKTYNIWGRQFQRYIKKSPDELGTDDVRNFLSYLAAERKVARATQNQALNALLFFYRHGLNKSVEGLDAVRARKRQRLPVVLSVQEIGQVFEALSGTMRLMAQVTYGCGLRLTECLNLRVKDVDVERGVVTVRSGKGDKDRTTVFPQRLAEQNNPRFAGSL